MWRNDSILWNITLPSTVVSFHQHSRMAFCKLGAQGLPLLINTTG